MSYATNSSTATRPRQHQQSKFDITFAKLVNRIRSTGELPTEEEQQETGQWVDSLLELVEAWQIDGEPGFADTLKALSKKNPRMSALLATIEDQAEQEEIDSRFTVGRKGKQIFRTSSMEDVFNFPDPEHIVAKLLEVATVSMLYGESSTGKTFIALSIALAIAYGMSWLGRRVKPGKVLYIYAEGRLGLKRRLRAYLKHNELQPTQNIQFIAVPVHLLEERQFLFDTIEDQEEIPALVVVDTYSNCASGTDQNSQSDVERVLSTCHDIARKYGAHVLVVHHTNLSGKYNGSAAFKNHVDTMLEASKAEKDGPIILREEKQREEDTKLEIKLQLQVIPLGTHPQTFEPITSCVVVASNAPTLADREQEQAEQEYKIMLAVLKEHGSLSKNQWQNKSRERGVPIRAFNKHIDKLIAQKKVREQLAGKQGQSNLYLLPASLEQSELSTPQTSENVQGVPSA